MRLADLRPTHESFMHLERYVNAGSPSGFSFVNTPGPGFRPGDRVERFQLPVFDCTACGAVNMGSSSALAVGELPVHPEMVPAFSGASGRAPSRYLSAAPTSSGRTLSVTADGASFYVKVAYQGLLGRVTRRMTRAHVLSAIEISALYESAIAGGKMPESFHVYREHCGLFFPEENQLKDWGYVERAVEPYPTGRFLEVPAFALICRPSRHAPSLLGELLHAVPQLQSAQGFFRLLLQPLVDLYFSSVTLLGLQPEAHAQNVVFLLDETYMPAGCALRDMESVDKDVPLLEARGLGNWFTPTGYKFLVGKACNYQIMHSFMYDFKLGQYLLGPLVDAWTSCTGYDSSALEGPIKEYARVLLGALPDDFFPEGVWYDYEAVVHEGAPTRVYRPHRGPRFR